MSDYFPEPPADSPEPPAYDNTPPPYAAREPPDGVDAPTSSGLLSPRVLILDRYIESLGHRYSISDIHGTRLGSIKPVGQRSRPSATKFHYVLTSNNGTELMSFVRSRQLLSGALRTEVSASVLYDRINGFCKQTDRNGDRGYSLHTVTVLKTSAEVRERFCITGPSTDDSYHTDFVDDSGFMVASVIWQKDNVGGHAACKIRFLADDNGRSLTSVNQRSVLLAAAISIDFDSVADNQKP